MERIMWSHFSLDVTSHMFAIKRLILRTCRLYNVFGSGANHAMYAQFIDQSALANRGRHVGLLRGAGTRFATWFYAMIRLVRMRNPLLATIHQEKFRSLELNNRARHAIIDIQDLVFWKALYAILRATYPAIRVLRYCDSNTPAMDKVFSLSHRTSKAIADSLTTLNDRALFSPLSASDGLGLEENEVYGVTTGLAEEGDE